MSIAVVNWEDSQRRAIQSETIINNHVVVPIMQTIVNVVPIVGMIVVIGNNNDSGGGGGGNNGGGGDACLRCCSTADDRPICGRRQAGWQ